MARAHLPKGAWSTVHSASFEVDIQRIIANGVFEVLATWFIHSLNINYRNTSHLLMNYFLDRRGTRFLGRQLEFLYRPTSGTNYIYYLHLFL
jgi:hypothetical protein